MTRRSQLYQKARELSKKFNRPLKFKYPFGTANQWSEYIKSFQIKRPLKKPPLPPRVRKTLNFVITYNLHVKKTGEIYKKNPERTYYGKIIIQAKYKLPRDFTILRRMAISEFKKWQIQYDYIPKITDVDMYITQTRILPKGKAQQNVKDQKLNAVIYALPNAPVSNEQYSKDCMLNYFIETANTSARYTNLNMETFKQKHGDFKDGMSCTDLSLLCRIYRIGCYAVLRENNEIVFKFLNDGKKCRATLMFYISNGHCYPIEDTKRKSFSDRYRTNKWKPEIKKADDLIKISDEPLKMLIKKGFNACTERKMTRKRKKHKDKKTPGINYIVDKLDFKNVIQIMSDLKVICTMKTSTRKGLYGLIFGKMKITLCEDISICQAIALALKVKWTGQGITQMVKNEFKNFTKLCPSVYNSNTLIFKEKMCQNTKPILCRFTESEDIKVNYKAVDVRRCYTSCCMLKQEFPRYTTLDEIEKYDNQKIKTGMYYVETKNNFPLRGTNWYSHIDVINALEENLITKSDIKYQFVSHFVVKSKMFVDFFKSIFKKCPKYSKNLINFFIGSLNQSKSKYETNYITSSKTEAIYYSQFPNTTCNFDNGFHIITRTQREVDNYTNSPIYNQIIAQGRWSVYRLSKLCENVIAIKTDCVIYTGKFKGQYGNTPGQYRVEKLPNDLSNVPYFEEAEIKQDFLDYKWITQGKWKNTTNHYFESNVPDNQSYCLSGRAGTGKSYILDKLTGAKIAFTNTASNKFEGGRTIHSYLKLSKDDDKIMNCSYENKIINVDETSMVSPKLWANFVKIKLNNPSVQFRCSGDFNQIQFIPEYNEVYERQVGDFKRIEDTYFFMWLCDFNKHTLHRSYRADKKLDQVLLERKNYKSICGKHTKSDINVVMTNKVRRVLNLECNERNKNDIMCKLDITELIDDVKSTYTLEFKKNTPWCSKVNNKKLKLLKNEFYTLNCNDKNEYIMTSGVDGIEQVGHNVLVFKSPNDIIKHFELAYAMTIYKLQGATITKPYIIHEWNHFFSDKYIKYTACSRAKYAYQYNII